MTGEAIEIHWDDDGQRERLPLHHADGHPVVPAGRTTRGIASAAPRVRQATGVVRWERPTVTAEERAMRWQRMSQREIDQRFDQLCTQDPTPATLREMNRLVDLPWEKVADQPCG